MPFINLYRSGWFHRKGKPNTYDAHPGDLYPTAQLAMQDIDPKARDLYIGTFPVLINGSIYGSVLRSDYDVHLNDADSVPVPLSVSRSEIIQRRNAVPKTPVLAEGDGLAIGGGSSDVSPETSEAEAVHLDPPNVVAFRTNSLGPDGVRSAAYRPTHGGYPG